MTGQQRRDEQFDALFEALRFDVEQDPTFADIAPQQRRSAQGRSRAARGYETAICRATGKTRLSRRAESRKAPGTRYTADGDRTR